MRSSNNKALSAIRFSEKFFLNPVQLLFSSNQSEHFGKTAISVNRMKTHCQQEYTHCENQDGSRRVLIAALAGRKQHANKGW